MPIPKATSGRLAAGSGSVNGLDRCAASLGVRFLAGIRPQDDETQGKLVGQALKIAALVMLATPALAEPAREAELRHLVLHDCGSCHGMTLKGGLGPPLLPSALAGKDGDALTEIVLDGIPKTPMPPWRPRLSEDEARWIVRTLQEGGF